MAFWNRNKNIQDEGEIELENTETNTDTDIMEKNTENTEEDNTEEDNTENTEELEVHSIFGSRNKDDLVKKENNLDDTIDKIIAHFTITDPTRINLLERGMLNKEDFFEEVKDYIRLNITKDKDEITTIIKAFSSFVFSYDVIDELIEDKEISDIKAYNWKHIRVKRLGKRETSNVKFRNEQHYKRFVEHVALKNKVSISDQNAAQNFTDKESSPDAILRFNITTDFINSNGSPILHIRKIPKTKYTRDELIANGFFTDEVAKYLENRVEQGGGFLFCGKGASGKTTCMNYLIDKISDEYSGLCIQENEELFSNHPDIAFEHTVENKGEGKIQYTLQDLARNGLLTDIDYFIIGEIKGAEALYLLNAVYTGARGWATVHGASATEAMKKLVDYIKYNSDYTQEDALEMLVHLDTVVFMENWHVAEIAEVEGFDEKTGNLKYKMILSSDGKFVG